MKRRWTSCSRGFDPSLKTIFLWEGVTYYLEAEAVDATLAWIRSHAVRGSAVIFDFIFISALTRSDQRGDVKRMQRYRRFTGEGLEFGIEEGRIQPFLEERGFRNIVDIGAEGLMRRYCTGPNQGRRVAEVYSIVHAEV
jgi:methyltransferase (TIGR00027 family)